MERFKSDQTSYRKISQNLEAVRFAFDIIRSLLKFDSRLGSNAAEAPVKFESVGWFQLQISRLWYCTRSDAREWWDNMSCDIFKRKENNTSHDSGRKNYEWKYRRMIQSWHWLHTKGWFVWIRDNFMDIADGDTCTYHTIHVFQFKHIHSPLYAKYWGMCGKLEWHLTHRRQSDAYIRR